MSPHSLSSHFPCLAPTCVTICCYKPILRFRFAFSTTDDISEASALPSYNQTNAASQMASYEPGHAHEQSRDLTCSPLPLSPLRRGHDAPAVLSCDVTCKWALAPKQSHILSPRYVTGWTNDRLGQDQEGGRERESERERVRAWRDWAIGREGTRGEGGEMRKKRGWTRRANERAREKWNLH